MQPLPASLQSRAQSLSKALLLLSHTPTKMSMRNGARIAITLLNDNGFPIYSQTIAIKPSMKDEMDACLTELVPIFQQSVVSYHEDPARTNAMIVDINAIRRRMGLHRW